MKRITLSVPTKLEPTWDELRKAASDEHHGIGTFICLIWKAFPAVHEAVKKQAVKHEK